ncbi:hypothetical protein E4665_07110 [Sporolactobacillus shoreae]|uniref:Uncharacterized protein n=1 Tax=Sporolactobacillus shoreae TaxID=1465501 RepID=A0A4Z0GPM7_9BACL|nr:hypothetical protein [Sporolactobacillus shoreae]TGA98626.1 hypothetical protein E4665_07110 [Sporolactobacillus shoreae]
MNPITETLIAIHQGEMHMTDRQFARKYQGKRREIRQGISEFELILEQKHREFEHLKKQGKGEDSND